MTKLLCYILLITSLIAEYPYRDIHKPIIQCPFQSKVIQISNPRTGSTVVYNILNYLFEDKNYIAYGPKSIRVLKLHSLERWNNKGVRFLLLVQTVRDPLDMAASFYKRINSHLDDFTDPMVNVLDREDMIGCIVKHIVLKYEKFNNNNFDYIFSKLEDELHIQIPKEEKDKMIQLFSKNALQQIADTYSSFDEYDSFTSVHGNHITNANFIDLFSLKEAKEIYEKSYQLRKRWGYRDLNLEKIYSDTKNIQEKK